MVEHVQGGDGRIVIVSYVSALSCTLIWGAAYCTQNDKLSPCMFLDSLVLVVATREMTARPGAKDSRLGHACDQAFSKLLPFPRTSQLRDEGAQPSVFPAVLRSP